MPGWLRTAVEWLPLQATVFTPVAIYLGKDGWGGIGVQAMWLVLLGAAVVLVWRRALHRVVVQGG
jgi:ABC-2 type transport system permease protein